MIRGFIKLFSFSTLGKLLGFIKIQLLTRYFGATELTDAIIIVMNIYWFWSNTIIFSLFSNTLIPSLANIKSEKKMVQKTVNTLVSSNILNFTMILILILFGYQVLYVFSPSSSDAFYENGYVLLTLMAPLLVLIPITEIFTLKNQFNEKFHISAINLSIWNLLQIISILWASNYLEKKILLYFFGSLTIVGYIASSFIQLSHSNFFSYAKFTDLFKTSLKSTKNTILKNLKFFLATVLFQINIYVNYAFISQLQSGYITIYDIVIKVPNIVQSLVLSAFTVLFFNNISIDKNNIGYHLRKYTYLLFVLCVLFLIYIYLYGMDTLYLIYGNEVFENKSGIFTVLLITSGNIYFMGKISLLIKVNIVQKKSNFLLLSTCIAFVINFIINFLFIESLGLKAAAFATLLAAILLIAMLQIFSKIQSYIIYIMDLLILVFILSLYFF